MSTNTRQQKQQQQPSADEILASIKAEIAKHIEPLSNNILRLTNQLEVLEGRLFDKDERIVELEAKVASLQHTLAGVREEVRSNRSENDALEQYGRRMNFRVEGVEVQADETPDSLQEQVVSILQNAGASISHGDIIRSHRTGKPRFRDDDGGSQSDRRVKVGQVIVRVNKWKVREDIHNQRKAVRAAGHPVKQDLTKRRRGLVTDAFDAIKAWGKLPVPVWAYANINCVPTMRRGNEAMKFTTREELQDALDHFKPRK